MTPKQRERYAVRAQILKALAHPSRLLMVDELSDGCRCVCELRDLVGSDMSTVSKHLSVLKAAGLVQDRKQGTQVFYELSAPCVLGFLECVENILRERIRRQLESLS